MNHTRFLVGPPPFDYNLHGADCANEWRNWLRGFELFLKLNKTYDDDEKCSMLLHYAGQKVQKVYFNLPPTSNNGEKGPLAGGYGCFETSEYNDAVAKLEHFFAPKRNNTYERHVSRRMKQESDEKIEVFTMRLCAQAERCELGEQMEGNIKDQLTEGCASSLLRRKILGRGDDDFDAVPKLAKVIEAVSEEQKIFGQQENQTEPHDASQEVNKIGVRQKIRNSSGDCSRCGYKGHKASDSRCAAFCSEVFLSGQPQRRK
ncbi:uncharacterized protein LOC118735059 [Rhagoletis pomonella]|uniref:uncharacterized protein LOC118735059 n=1 Tax=Rhagoletis pomonella TaxID=28610 RepID=UPI00177AC353|nr:uncharacterized protein LOC118735059 [Rhagoletis pomonella]